MAVAVDKTPPELTTLLARLGDSNPRERIAALALLLANKMVSSAIDAIAARLQDESEAVRRMAILVLGEAGAPAIDALASALAEAQPTPLRIMAVVGIARATTANVDMLRSLVGCLASNESDLRFHASLALGKAGPASVPILREALTSHEIATRIGAADALGYAGATAKEAVADLKSAAAETAAVALRVACAAALVKISRNPVPELQALVTSLSDADPKQRADVLRRIGELQTLGRDAAQSIVKCLTDFDSGVRATAALALAQVQAVSKDTAPVLIGALNDAEPAVRANAAIALSSAPAEAGAAAGKLREMQSDQDSWARAAAKAALERIAAADR